MGIIIKSEREIRLMREAGRIVAHILAELAEKAKPGVATIELDQLAERLLTRHKAAASFKGYRGYPSSVCVSINEEVVHGIPGRRALHEADIVSLDFGAIYKGFHGDAALTVGVGKVSAEAQRLLEATRGSLEAGIAAVREGSHLGDVSHAIQAHVEERGCSVVREYVGHGIGREMHEAPQVPNFGEAGEGVVLKRGMTLAIEPMVNAGGWKTRLLGNHWTVVTEDRSLSAHFEHTVVVRDGYAEVLTAL